MPCAALAFACLGHPGRLAVFRLLMRFAPQGVRPTEMAEALGFKPNTLSHHLNDLANAGLIGVERRSRSLLYSVDLGAAEDLIAYLALDVGRARPDLLAPFLLASKDRSAMRDTEFDVLFICSGNSARSIFAEALLRDLGGGRFRAFSAGTRPSEQINPLALEVLRGNGHDVEDLRSKHLSEFQQPGAPVMDFVFTVCDTAAAEECPPPGRASRFRATGVCPIPPKSRAPRPRGGWPSPRPTPRCAAASPPSWSCPSRRSAASRSRRAWTGSASRVNP